MHKKIKTLATKEEIKKLATKTKLKAEQEKLVQLQAYILSLFIGRSYFVNDGAQLYIILQLLCYTLERLSDTEKVVSWKSKDLSTEIFTTPNTTDVVFIHQLNWTKFKFLFNIYRNLLKTKKAQLLLFQI